MEELYPLEPADSLRFDSAPGSLTDSGRYRAQLNSFWRQEIVIDFFFELSVYGTYDSQPPEGALQTSDYGLVTSIGYSFWP